MSTQAILAKELGVSRETVSRSFSGHSKVSKKTRKRVLEYALKVGYKPNSAARIMQGNRKFGTIAYVSTSDWFFGGETLVTSNIRRFMPEVIRQASLAGTFVVPETFCIMERELCEYPRIFTESCVDGIIAENSQSIPAQLDKLLSQSGVPIVWINHRRAIERDSYSAVSINPDEVEAGRQLASHLIELGHEKIGFLTVNTVHFSNEDRYRGLCSEMERGGLGPVARLETAQGLAVYDPDRLKHFLGPDGGHR